MQPASASGSSGGGNRNLKRWGPIVGVIAVVAVELMPTALKTDVPWVIIVAFLCYYRTMFCAGCDPGYYDVYLHRFIRISILYAGFAFIISLIREVVKDMEDMDGDARYGCKTMPIVWGIPASKMFVAVWLVVLISLMGFGITAVPFPLAWAVDALSRRSAPWWAMVVPGAAWLAFFPNAPYLVTDLIHLTPSDVVPLWFDALLYFSVAATGLLLGLVSLYLVQASVRRSAGSRAGWGVSALAISLGAYGIYLGRIERWNSWDVVTAPSSLLHAIATSFSDLARSRESLLLVLGFVVFTAAVYLTLYAFANLVRADGAVDAAEDRAPRP